MLSRGTVWPCALSSLVVIRPPHSVGGQMGTWFGELTLSYRTGERPGRSTRSSPAQSQVSPVSGGTSETPY